MSSSLDRQALATHVLRALGRAQVKGRALTIEDVARTLKVRKSDVRAIAAQLDTEGHVDALRLRLTLSGLALATAMEGKRLRPLRPRKAAASAAA